MTTPDTLRERVTGKPGLRGATCILRSGLYFDFIDPDPATIRIDDIAWALAHICRFNGHAKRFYSVAQHSVLVAHLVPAPHKFAALMHDAAEAYIGDMVGPLKQLMPEFKVVEARIERVVFDRFEIPHPLDCCIKHADLRMLRTEQRDLTAAPGDSWSGLDQFQPMEETIVPWSPEIAYKTFLAAFEKLAPERVL